MAKIKKRGIKIKKGVLFTLGTFFIAATILALAILIFHNTEESRERVSELGSLDRLFDLSSSAQIGMREIFELYADFNVSIEESIISTNVSFTENISTIKDNWGEELKDKMSNFKNNVESSDQNIKLNIIAVENKELPLLIMPHNITYNRSWAVDHVRLNVIPTIVNFTSSDILINTTDKQILEDPTTIINLDSFYFRVIVLDNYGNYFVKENYVNSEQENKVTISLSGGDTIEVTLQNQSLEIWTNSDIPVLIKTKIGLPKTIEKSS